MERESLVKVDTIRTLAHVALMAAAEGDVPAADRILVALEGVRPKEPTIRICRAMVLTRQEKYAECLVLLREVTQEYPSNQTVKSLLGFVMFTTGESGWQAILEEVIKDGSDPASVELAQMILAEEKEDKTAGGSQAASDGRRFIRYA